jgi:hypothetical protein
MLICSHAQLLSHAAAAEADATRWAAQGALILPAIRRRDAAALRRLAQATEPAWCAVHVVRAAP